MSAKARVALRNDFVGPSTRPLLRLSRFGGNGVFFIRGQDGVAHAAHPNGTTTPFIETQGGYMRHDNQGRAVVTPLGGGVVGDQRSFGIPVNQYARHPLGGLLSRFGMWANRGGQRQTAVKCPHCGGEKPRGF